TMTDALGLNPCTNGYDSATQTYVVCGTMSDVTYQMSLLPLMLGANAPSPMNYGHSGWWANLVRRGQRSHRVILTEALLNNKGMFLGWFVGRDQQLGQIKGVPVQGSLGGGGGITFTTALNCLQQTSAPTPP